MEKYYTPDEVGDILKVKRLTVYRWIAAGKLSAKKVGRGLRIAERDLAVFIDTQGEPMDETSYLEQIQAIYDKIPDEPAGREEIIKLLQELESIMAKFGSFHGESRFRAGLKVANED